MKPSISKVFLHTGQDLNLGNNLVIKHPKIKDIVLINNGFYCEEIYFSYVQSLLSDPYSYMVFLDDQGIDYEAVHAIDVLNLRWQNPNERHAISDALSFFLGERKYNIVDVDGQIVIYDENDKSFAFSSAQFDWILEFISQINCVSSAMKIKPATKSAKKILIEDMRDEMKRALKKKKKDETSCSYLGDGITALLYGGISGVTPFNFESLSIYQLLHGSNSIHSRMKVSALLNGVYTGMIKPDKISQEEFRWT